MGGSNVSLNSTTPFAVGNTFRQWRSSYTVDPAPTMMAISQWVDVSEIGEVYAQLRLSSSLNSSLQKLFRFPDNVVTPATSAMLCKENTKTIGISASIRRALTWESVRSNASLSTKFQHLQDRVLTHQNELDGTVHYEAVERHQERLAGNFSWFVANDFTHE